MSSPAVASSHSAPGPIAPSATFQFAATGGVGLYGEWFAADQPRATALVLHGYLEHCGRYRELAHVLTAAGVATLTYDMRGHGRAEGQRSYIGSFGDYLDDLDAAAAELDRRAAELSPERTLPRLLIGHSNGALTALRALCDPARAPAGITAAILSSPFLGFKVKVPALKAFVGKIAGRFLPTLSLPSELPLEHLTSDPDKQRERRLDTLCNDVASSGWFLAVQETHAYVAAHASAVALPTLWVVGGDDHIADPAVSRTVSSQLGTAPRYHELAGFQHEVFNERERGQVFDLVRAFIDDVVPPA
ncbi:alpha/beta hydrolase [Haliangium sp.]|uniref:alpha/beta hydrolase n=1 Tax=Haliangium sp. TaxID=2663208 RepID=UPI003D095D8B